VQLKEPCLVGGERSTPEKEVQIWYSVNSYLRYLAASDCGSEMHSRGGWHESSYCTKEADPINNERLSRELQIVIREDSASESSMMLVAGY